MPGLSDCSYNTSVCLSLCTTHCVSCTSNTKKLRIIFIYLINCRELRLNVTVYPKSNNAAIFLIYCRCSGHWLHGHRWEMNTKRIRQRSLLACNWLPARDKMDATHETAKKRGTIHHTRDISDISFMPGLLYPTTHFCHCVDNRYMPVLLSRQTLCILHISYCV